MAGWVTWVFHGSGIMGTQTLGTSAVLLMLIATVDAAKQNSSSGKVWSPVDILQQWTDNSSTLYSLMTRSVDTNVTFTGVHHRSH